MAVTKPNTNFDRCTVCPACREDGPNPIFMFTTKPGTALSTFEDYIKTLADSGTGRQIVYPYLTWQSYVTHTTCIEASEIAKEPFVNYVVLSMADEDRRYWAERAEAEKAEKAEKVVAEEAGSEMEVEVEVEAAMAGAETDEYSPVVEDNILLARL